MALARTKDWAYPAEIKDIKDVDTYLRHHYQQHVEESQSRIEDFESLEIDTLTVTDWTIQTSFKPSADNAVDLAATTLRFKDLYLAGNLKDDTVTLTVANAKSAYTHVSATGTDHGYINQDVQSSASPTFNDLITTDNIGVGISGWGTSAAKVLGIGGSTAPTTSPADMVQLWSADRGGNAGYAQLHYRTESGKARPLIREFDVSDYGLVPDDNSGAVQTANVTAWDALIGDVAGGDKIYFPKGVWYINDDLVVSRSVTIYGDGKGSEIQQEHDSTTPIESPIAKAVFNISVSKVTIRDLKLYGFAAPASLVPGGYAIYAHGADSSNYIADIKVLNCFIDTWEMAGIYCHFVRQFEYSGNHIESITYAGIMGISVLDGHIHHNFIDDIKCSTGDENNGYGISVTRFGSASLASQPRSARILIDHNIIKNVALWEGLDTHSGEQITFDSNQVYDCKNGLTVTGTTLSEGEGYVQVIAREIHVINNLLDASGLTLGETDAGLYFSNANTSGVTGTIIGNTIKNYGDEDSIAGTPTGGIRIYYTDGLIVKGNHLENCSPAAIIFDVENSGFVCTGNTISNPWTDTADNGNGHARGIYVVRTNNTGYIGENTIIRGTNLAKTYELDTAADDDGRAIEVANAAGNEIQLGANYSEATTALVDTGNKASVVFWGNALGVGVAPTVALDILGDGRFGGIGEATKIALWNGVGDERAFLQLTGTGGGELIIDADSDIQMKPANTLAVTFQVGGNVGINTADIEAWHGSYRAIEFAASAIMSNATNPWIGILSNAYFDGTWRYKITDFASNYYQSSGEHFFNVAASGTENNEIDWTTAMHIDAAGDVSVSGCVSDTTCEIMKNEDALAIIDDILKTGSGKKDKYKHERMDMKKIHSKYPFMIHEQITEDEDGKKETKYLDKLGAKSDLIYVAIGQLQEKIETLEARIDEQIHI